MDPKSTCWILIQGAASGKREDREAFGRSYEPVIRAYLGARWKGSPRIGEIDDAVQEVFVECFRAGGVLEHADASRPGGFRAFLYGVVRNVALRFERKAGAEREARPGGEFDPDLLPRAEATLSRAFDRAWAEALLREAGKLQEDRAGAAGEGAPRRLELLRLRFQEDMPIREIAKLWGVEAPVLHKEYAKAREEFKEALLQVVAFHHPGLPGEVERECAELLALLKAE